MKKRQEWLIAGVAIVLLATAVAFTFWYVMENSSGSETATTNTERTAEQKSLIEAEADLSGVKDLDLSALDTVDKDLQAIDLGEL
jgi:flagellar basal body-associated protein FliL